MKYLFLILILLISVNFVFSQEKTKEKPICKQPFSTKFDEFEFTNLEDAKERLDLFGLQIKNLNAQGVVIGYGGKVTESDQGRSISFKVEDYITDKFNFHRFFTISKFEGGHRDKPTIELFIKPQTCSENPTSSPTLSYDEVSYKEEASFFEKDTVIKTVDKLEKLVIKKLTPVYPSAAKAIRARGKVLLLVIVDENGNVIKTMAIDGHPFLKAASTAAVRHWKYQPLKENNKNVQYGGKVIIDWDIIADKWYSEYELIQD